MDSFDLIFGCVALFFIVMLIKNAFKYVIGETSLVSIFVCLYAWVTFSCFSPCG